MNNATFKLSIAASVLLAAVSTASAQSMKAEVPFAFDAGKTHLQAGTYSVNWERSAGGAPLVRIHSVETKKNIMAIGRSERYHSTPAENVALQFQCTDGRCELAGLRTPTSDYTFATAKPGAGTRIAMVVLRPDRAE